MEKQKLIYVESKAQFSPSEVSDKAIVFIKDTKEIWTHGVYFSCSGTWATPITLSLTGDTTGSVSIDGSGNASIATTTNYLSIISQVSDANSAANTKSHAVSYYRINSGSSNLFPVSSNANGILSLNVHDYSYTHQLGFSSDGNIYHRRRNGGTWETSWKTILNSSNYTNFPHTFASLTNKPTTLSGYGITDCIPIINGGIVTTDTDLSTLGMTTSGVKFSISRTTDGAGVPSWWTPYSNFLMFRSTGDTYSGIATYTFSEQVTFVGGRNLETTANNVPNWWFRIKGASGTTYDLNSFQNIINNLDSNYLRKSGGTMTGNITLTTDAAYITDSKTQHFIFGTISPSTTTGVTGVNGMDAVFAGRLTNMVLRTSGDNLYHYNHSKSARYLILDTNNYSSYALPLSGGTMKGALNLANNTWNKVGDDAYMGDCNVAGMIGIKGSNATTPGFAMYNNSGTLLGKLYASGTSLYWSNAKILTASGTSKQFIMGDGSLDSTSYLKVDGTNGTSDGVSTLLNKLSTGGSTPTDADYYICQWAGGGTTTTSYHRRPMSAMYAYIKSKATSDFLPIGGGTLGSSSASFTDLFIKSSTAKLRLLAYSNSTNYIQSGNSAFNGNADLKITGYLDTTGSNLYFKFANIYCRADNYTNIDSGNYNSYALPLSGGTLTGTLISRDIRPSANVSYSLGTSSYYYNYVYAKYFKKNGSSDSYVLLGGGGHKAVSDFTMKEQKTTTSISGNTDQWSIILEQSYPADHWYDIVNTFLVEGVQFGSGFLSFYAYWQVSSSAFNNYITEVYFNGTMRGETTAGFGGSNRDINDFLRIYIDKTNYKLLVYANHYNGKTVRIKRINYNEIDTAGFPNGGILVEHFNDKGTIVSLPTESSTMTRVLIKTHYNHDRTIKTSKSIYASSFYENSDIRLKENIQRIDQSDLTKQVDLVQFNFKDSDTKKYGVIAQQLEQVGLQNLVYENDGKKAVDYISLLVLEIQRLRNEIGELKQEINKKS